MLVTLCVVTWTSNAQAASVATATSVGLSATASCSDADLDLGITSGDVDRELGTATNAASTTLAMFEQDSTGIDGYDGVFPGYSINLDVAQPDGTIIGSYAYLGTTPPTAQTTAEWFVLYRCGNEGDNQVLFSCFGDYGTCPRTAPQALDQMLRLTPSTVTPAPGAVVAAIGSGCPPVVGRVAAVSLLRDGALLTSDYPITPADDGTFDATVTVPADLADGAALVLRAVCGDGDLVVSSTEVALTVTAGAAPVDLPDAGTPTTAPDGTTRPLFTG
jgi:hypothetical protein